MEGRVRRPVTEEELLDEQIAEELADLPDDEGMQEEQEEGAVPVQQELGRRRTLPEYAPEPEQEEASEEEEEEDEEGAWQAAAATEAPRTDLRKRGVSLQEEAAAQANTAQAKAGPKPAARLLPPSTPSSLVSAARLAPPPMPPPSAAIPSQPPSMYTTLPQPSSNVPASNLYSTLPQPAAPSSTGAEDDAEPAAKRARLSSSPPQSAATESKPAEASSCIPSDRQQQQTGDQIAAALLRLTSHISNPTKFPKASQLLRQLLDSGTVGKQHRALVFDAVRATFSLQPGRHQHLVDPANRREVMKLMALIEGLATGPYFKAAEKTQINSVYHLLGVTCNEMQTDDSFIFSKVLAKVREAVDELPEQEPGCTDPEELAAYAHVTQDKPGSCTPAPAAGMQAASGTGVGNAEQGKQDVKSETKPEVKMSAGDDPFGLDVLMQPAGGHGKHKSSSSSAAAAAAEDDPFGLNRLIDEKPAAPPRPKAVKPTEPPSSAWGPTELLAARRCAVLMCVQHARHTFHRHTWAQTGIELLAEHCWKNKLRFSGAQVEELDELWAWVRKARAQRKMGPTAKELNRDATSFDRARADWSRATVSVRGKVGAQGDAKSTNWLG